MFKDINGFDCWIDLECRIHRVVQQDLNYHHWSYENIIKNMNKPDFTGNFNIKTYKNGVDILSYSYVTTEFIMENPEFRKIMKVLNPEMILIYSSRI